MPAYDYDCAACGRRFEVIHGVHAERPDDLPGVRRRPDPEGDQRAGRPLQGLRLGQEGATRDEPRRASRAVGGRARATDGDGQGRGGRPPRPAKAADASSGTKTGRHEVVDVLDARPTDDGRADPTGSRWPRRPRSWPPRTSISRPRRSAAGRAPGGSRASSSAAGGSSAAARSGRSSPLRGGFAAEDVQPGLFEDLGG